LTDSGSLFSQRRTRATCFAYCHCACEKKSRAGREGKFLQNVGWVER